MVFFFFTQQHMDPIFQVSEKGKSSESKCMKNVAFSKTQCGWWRDSCIGSLGVTQSDPPMKNCTYASVVIEGFASLI